jgi:hypothetical protein
MTQDEEKELELFKEWLKTPEGSICKYEEDIAKRAWLARAKLDRQIVFRNYLPEADSLIQEVKDIFHDEDDIDKNLHKEILLFLTDILTKERHP